jgi:hypothetical protein
VDPGENGYDAIRAKQFLKTLVARLQASPGVIAAGVASHSLLEGGSWNMGMTIENRPADSGRRRITLNNMITPGYFNALGMHLVSGRAFDDRDDRLTTTRRENDAFRVAIANEAFVRQFLEGEPAVGRRIGLGDDPGTPTQIEIVGDVRDATYKHVDAAIQPHFFFSILEWGPRNFVLYLRTSANPAAMVGPARAVLTTSIRSCRCATCRPSSEARSVAGQRAAPGQPVGNLRPAGDAARNGGSVWCRGVWSRSGHARSVSAWR